MNGHPDNPAGAGRLATDAIDALAAKDPNFPWADYDKEDQADRDGDGNLFEPDGVIDHLVLVHAGQGKSRGGGDQGVYAVWAHSSTIAGGYTIPGTNLKASNYIVQPEDAGVGVFAHEFGHDLGLPDLYDTSGNADSDIDFWDLMASGSHSGEVFQALPTHMGIWDKWVLGWADPLTIRPGSNPRQVKLGQSSRTPIDSEDGIKVDLPDKVTTLATPHSGTKMWHSNNDQELGRRQAQPLGRGARRRGRQVLDVEQLHHRRGLGLRLRRALDGRRDDLDRAEGVRRGRRRGHHAGRLPGPERPDDRLRRQEVRPDRQHRRLAARLRRPVGVRGHDGAAAAAPGHRRGVRGAQLVRRRLLGHRRRRHHLE